jgi:hypothetical protein
MILQNKKLSKEFDRLTNQIFFTFARWELYENLEKIIDNNKYLKEAILKGKIDFHIFKLFLSVSFPVDILVSLRRLLRDENPKNLSLLRVLIDKEKENPEINIFKEILKGNFKEILKNLQENIKTFQKEIERIQDFQNLLKDLQRYLKDLQSLAEEINALPNRLPLKDIKKLEKIKEDLLKLKDNLQKTQKDIKNKIEIVKKEKISTTIKRLNLEKEWEDFKKRFPGRGVGVIWEEVLKYSKFLNQYQEEIENLDRDIQYFDSLENSLEKKFEEINKNIEQLYHSLVFKELWEITNKSITHLSREEFPEITILLKEKREVAEKVIKEIFYSLGNNITSVTPIYQDNYFTAFMIPWLQPACNESQKIETISKIDKYKDEDHFICELTLTNGLSFLGDFPSEYKWEEGDEVAIFWSYNYQNPQNCFVICNFSKKQWVKGMVSWVSNRKGSWILPKI